MNAGPFMTLYVMPSERNAVLRTQMEPPPMPIPIVAFPPAPVVAAPDACGCPPEPAPAAVVVAAGVAAAPLLLPYMAMAAALPQSSMALPGQGSACGARGARSLMRGTTATTLCCCCCWPVPVSVVATVRAQPVVVSVERMVSPQ